MNGERLRLVVEEDPMWRLWRALPEPWRGPVIGAGIENWAAISENNERRLNLKGLPELIAAEMAWMAHWQAADGTRSSILALNQLANILRRATAHDKAFPDSIRAMDWDCASALQNWFYLHRWGRMCPQVARPRLRVVFRFARLALIAACHQGPWWELDEWHPRCDPRIPLSEREPLANYGCPPGQISTPWLRSASKWHLGTALEAGTLRWTTVSQERLKCLRRFDNWLSAAFDDPLQVLSEPAAAVGHAAAFARWCAEPGNRMTRVSDRRHVGKPVGPRQVNDDLRAVAELLAFVAANTDQAHAVLGPGPWHQITDTHAAAFFRQVTRIKHQRDFNDEHYVDDRALAQITAALPLLGMARTETMEITRGDGTVSTAAGFDDPQSMRMILLQILTGRRASEIRTCDFDCLSAVPASAVKTPENEAIARFRYAQSKIDIAPDTILVDQDVVSVIREQQRWVTERFGFTPKFLFIQRTGNRGGDKAFPSGTYNFMLRELSDLIQITDAKGRAVKLSHTHRFRHTKLTRLAELGLPVHVLMRYAGHATPTMTMHYIAAREEHAEQAFLATVKLRADGTALRMSREDHDSLHLFDRADRLLPNGWCLLPPLQSCDKGNACLTCSVFVTDASHRAVLERQLADTRTLIDTTTSAFADRHGRSMPEDNVWLAQRRAETQALARVLAAIEARPGRAPQGAGCPSAPTGPVPVAIDAHRHREATR
jgi:integrase